MRQHSDVGLVRLALKDLLNGPQGEPQAAHPPAHMSNSTEHLQFVMIIIIIINNNNQKAVFFLSPFSATDCHAAVERHLSTV